MESAEDLLILYYVIRTVIYWSTGAGSFDVSYVTLMSSVYCRMRLFVFILCVGVVRERRWLQLTADSRVFEKVRRKDESGYLWSTHDAA